MSRLPGFPVSVVVALFVLLEYTRHRAAYIWLIILRFAIKRHRVCIMVWSHLLEIFNLSNML